jgi:hypothetical protein
MASRENLARAFWTVFEPIHSVVYFSAEARAALAEIGLERYWDGYFAGRAAALGEVSGAPVIAMFSGFAPFLVNRALPAAWAIATPAEVIEARYIGAENTLRSLAPDVAVVEAAADALTPLVADLNFTGRPLSAAYAALPLQDDPYRRLWQVAGTLREHRGDGHVIALASLEIGGITTLLLRSAVDLDGGYVQKARGWTDEEWNAEAARLVRRGLLQKSGGITPAGAKLLDEAERLTNRLALGAIASLTDDQLRSVAAKLAPVARTTAGLFPQPNPIGMPASWDPTADPEAAGIAESPIA